MTTGGQERWTHGEYFQEWKQRFKKKKKKENIYRLHVTSLDFCGYLEYYLSFERRAQTNATLNFDWYFAWSPIECCVLLLLFYFFCIYSREHPQGNSTQSSIAMKEPEMDKVCILFGDSHLIGAHCLANRHQTRGEGGWWQEGVCRIDPSTNASDEGKHATIAKAVGL